MIFFKLAANDRSDKRFLLTSQSCPLGLTAPAPGLYTCIKSWKILYKIRLQRDFFLNEQQMTKMTRCSCWHKNFVPKGLSAPVPGLYTCIKSWKILYKIRLQRDFFLNEQQMTKMTRCSCWHKNFVHKGLSAPVPGLYTRIKSWKKLYKIRLERDFFETCSKWPKWREFSVDIKMLSPGVVCPWPAAIYIY